LWVLQALEKVLCFIYWGTLDKADKGAVRLNEAEVNSLQGKRLADFRNRNIGFVFQFHHLLPEFTALENVCIPGWLAGRKRKEVENKAKELLTLLGLNERLENKPNQMSGGEQQRVAVARALINGPSIVFRR
jgi:lipoprotein-releasing system ATP-binding protein